MIISNFTPDWQYKLFKRLYFYTTCTTMCIFTFAFCVEHTSSVQHHRLPGYLPYLKETKLEMVGVSASCAVLW